MLIFEYFISKKKNLWVKDHGVLIQQTGPTLISTTSRHGVFNTLNTTQETDINTNNITELLIQHKRLTLISTTSRSY